MYMNTKWAPGPKLHKPVHKFQHLFFDLFAVALAEYGSSVGVIKLPLSILLSIIRRTINQ